MSNLRVRMRLIGLMHESVNGFIQRESCASPHRIVGLYSLYHVFVDLNTAATTAGVKASSHIQRKDARARLLTLRCMGTLYFGESVTLIQLNPIGVNDQNTCSITPASRNSHWSFVYQSLFRLQLGMLEWLSGKRVELSFESSNMRHAGIGLRFLLHPTYPTPT